MTKRDLFPFSILAVMFLLWLAVLPACSVAPDDTNKSGTLPATPSSIPRAEAVTNKRVYLTFDDGPNNIFTPRILDILKQEGARATFMVVGTNVVKNPEVVHRIVDEGNGLANHTFSHNYKKIYRSPEAFIADLNRCSDAVQAITGRPVKVFRAPGGPENL
ncbi:polysaccharide deacetylase family protein, partial [Desulfofundulus sp.]|uniref:polysaccharide deacetylase family protein n=1 Tax=Desulfofundulus sp. TaxID=2282750 RepID=UPI003C732C3A